MSEPYVIQGTPILSRHGRHILLLTERIRELQETICDEYCSVEISGRHHGVCEHARRPLLTDESRLADEADESEGPRESPGKP